MGTPDASACWAYMSEDLPKEVLVVEDEPLVRMAAADSLVERGIMAWEAGDACEAMHVLEKHPRIGLVFTDINMPGRPDGLGLARQISSERPEIELVVTSGAVHLTDDDLPDDGVFLRKPYTSERLLEIVEEKLGAAEK